MVTNFTRGNPWPHYAHRNTSACSGHAPPPLETESTGEDPARPRGSSEKPPSLTTAPPLNAYPGFHRPCCGKQLSLKGLLCLCSSPHSSHCFVSKLTPLTSTLAWVFLSCSRPRTHSGSRASGAQTPGTTASLSQDRQEVSRDLCEVS